MGTPTSSTPAQSLTFYDFLDRMRNPASIDLVRSIKSFIVSFSFNPANPETDGKSLQDFLSTMEVAIRDHPLWASATEEEIHCAMEGLEKYVMTKLFSRTFSSSPEDVKIDLEISEKINSLQKFLRPEHLDIPAVFRNEASWLLAEKELLKINAFRAPREKLLCILSCCRVINNLLMNASMSENRVSGADDFLPVLIYVTIKANPPQLHSNLKFIQLYRRQSELISEAAYYFTNLVSVKSFIADLDAKSLSIDETEFIESMQAARLANEEIRMEPSHVLDKIADVAEPSTILNKLRSIKRRSSYPFMESEAGELTVGDVEKLLSLYKDVVRNYTSVCDALRHLSISKIDTTIPRLEGTHVLRQPEDQMKVDKKQEN